MPKLISYRVFLICLSLCFFGCGAETDPYKAFKKGDYSTSYALLKPMAKDGDAEAQNYLGVHYYLGLGIAKDHRKAVDWYTQAAKQGHADAQRNLGDMYNGGYGVAQDEYQAFIWYFAATQQGNESAKPKLDVLASDNNMSPNKQMHAKMEANEYILDPKQRFMSHDTYIKKN